MSIIWNNEERKILIDNFHIKSTNELLNLLPNRNLNSINAQAYKFKIKKLIDNHNKDGQLKRKHTINDDYFAIPNLENSYWAGFIAADGCITNINYLKIELTHSDGHHLELFRKAIEFSGNISNTKRIRISRGKNKKLTTYNFSNIRINSTKIYNDLKNIFNIAEKKSLTHIPPNLSEELFFSYLAGYIDGDGCVSLSKKNRLSLQLCGSKMFLEYVKEKFDILTPGLYHRNATVQKTKSEIYKYAIEGGRAYDIISLLQSYNIPRLQRKVLDLSYYKLPRKTKTAHWDTEKDEYILTNRYHKTYIEIAKYLNITKSQLAERFQKLKKQGIKNA